MMGFAPIRRLMVAGFVLLLAWIVFLCPAAAQTGSAPEAAMQRLLETAGRSATAWLALVDAGDYAKSWGQASEYSRSQSNADQWAAGLERARKALGEVLSREIYTVDYVTELPGAPPGQYVVIIFATTFANKPQAFEWVAPKLDPDGQWRVSGYHVY